MSTMAAPLDLDLNELVTYSLSFDKLQGVLQALAGTVASQNDRLVKLEAAQEETDKKLADNSAVKQLTGRLGALEQQYRASEAHRASTGKETDSRLAKLEAEAGEPKASAEEVEGLKGRVAELEVEVTTLKTRVALLEDAGPVAATDGDLREAVTELQGDVTVLKEQGAWKPTTDDMASDAAGVKTRVEVLEGKVAGLSVMPASGGGDVDAGTLETLRRHEAEITTLQTRVKDNSMGLAALKAEVAALQAAVASAQGEARSASHAAAGAHTTATEAAADVAALRDLVNSLGGDAGNVGDLSALWEAVRAAQGTADAALGEGRTANAAHEVVNDEMESIRATLRMLAETLAKVGGLEDVAVQRILSEATEADRPASRGAIYDRATDRASQQAAADAVRSGTPISQPGLGGEGKEESKSEGGTLDQHFAGQGGLPTAGSLPAAVQPVPVRRDGVVPPSTGAASLPVMSGASTAVPAAGVGTLPASAVHLVPKETTALNVLPELHALQRLAAEIQAAVGQKANTTELRQLAAQVEKLMAMLAARGSGGPVVSSGSGDGNVGALALQVEDLASRLATAEAGIRALQMEMRMTVTGEQLAAALAAGGHTPGAMGLNFGASGVTVDQLDGKADHEELARLARTVQRLMGLVRTLRSADGAGQSGANAALVTKQIFPGFKCLVCDSPLDSVTGKTALPAIAGAQPRPPGDGTTRYYSTPARSFRRPAGGLPGDTGHMGASYRDTEGSVASFAALSDDASEADKRHPAFPYNTPQAPHMDREHGRSPVLGERVSTAPAPIGMPTSSTRLPNGTVLNRASTPSGRRSHG